MKNIVGVYLAGDSTGEAQHSGRIYDQQFLVSHVVPLACYSLLFSMYVQADTLEAFDIYDGANPFKALYLRMRTLTSIRWLTGSQWSALRTRVMCSCLWVFDTKRAAEFCNS